MDHETNLLHLVVSNLLRHVYHKFFVYPDPIKSEENEFSSINVNTIVQLLRKRLRDLEIVLELLDHFCSCQDAILLLIYDRIFLFDSMLPIEADLKFYKNLV